LTVYSLASPATPSQLSQIQVSTTSTAWALAASTTHAYVASDGALTVIDLACP
jgi:hypothetical protein